MRKFFTVVVLIIITCLLRLSTSACSSTFLDSYASKIDTIKSGIVIKHNKKASSFGLKNNASVKTNFKPIAKTVRHLRILTARQTDKFILMGNLPDSLAAVTLINFETGETARVYPFSSVADTAKPELASANLSGRFIDMYSAAPNSFYFVSAGGYNTYRISAFKSAGVLSIRTIDNNIGTMGMAAFSPALDTMKMPLRERIPDSLRARVLIVKLRDRIKVMGLDSLKLLVKKYKNDTLKAAIFSEIADRYMDYDTISNKRKRLSYQNNAVTYSTLAMQQYYKGSDSLGMRGSFDNMAKVYYAQGKFSQAKWFILQSNSLSRGKSDVPNVIKSLVILAGIKSQIGDYTLAMKDLDEAMGLAIKHNYLNYQSEVLKNYGLLYSRLKNYPKEQLVLKKRDSVEAEINKKEQDSLLTKVIAADSIETKKIDSIQVKKKVFSSTIRKQSKASSAKKLASL